MTVSHVPLDLAGFPWPRSGLAPPDLYAALRRDAPVTRVALADGQPVWLVSRYDDVRALLADPRVSADSRRPGFPAFGARPSNQAGRQFLRMDAPEHTVYRRLIAPHFTPRRVEAWRPRVRELVEDAVDRMVTGATGPVDLVAALSLPVPSTVLAWLLGVRAEDRDFFADATRLVMARADPDAADAEARGEQAGWALRRYVGDLVAERDARDDPGTDILGTLVRAAREGRITRQDVENSATLLVIAGHDTTASMISLGVLALLLTPGALAALRDDPTGVANAVEELLRYLTVVHLIVLRVAVEDIEIGGATIPAGEGIIPLTLSADRDEEHFREPDRLDLCRAARDHMAFGYGPHQCIGQNLARMELQEVVACLARRLPDLRPAVEPERLRFSSYSQIFGVEALPVTW